MPLTSEEEVDFHFVCFVKSSRTDRLYELDGDRRGPLDTGVMIDPKNELFPQDGVDYVRDYIQRQGNGDWRVSLPALTSI